MSPLVFLAAWSVLSFPAALAVGAALNVAQRRTAVVAQPVPVPVPVHARRTV